jgi:arylsulfatase A-like enzyme
MSDETDFDGVIGRTFAESKEAWTQDSEAAPGDAPDIVFILLDDVGFSDLGCFGSEIETPNMDRLAQGGVRHTNFHVVSMCSPTRACLLTGRNAHSVGMGTISEWAGGFPGYRGLVTRRAATLAEILRDRGYGTIAVGKWHLTPMKEVSAAGPFTNWPLGRGFDRWYGFQGAFTDQWNPELYRDNQPIEAPAGADYHLSEDLVDQAINYIDNHKTAAPERPYFLYLAFGACHWPHHVPKPFVDKYEGRYAAGWDAVRDQRFARQKATGVIPRDTELAAPNPGVPAWSELSDDERQFCARSQEVYAGFVDHTDQQIGRLLSFLEARGHARNTLVVLLSDNGASPEGGPLGTVALNARKHLYHGAETAQERSAALDTLGDKTTFPHYAFGWAQTSNTPLKWYKMNTYSGGVRSPLIMHWPAKIKAGGLQSQFHHVIDVVPTVLDILGIDAPQSYRGVAQMPVQGVSMKYAFNAPDAPTRKTTQFFELAGDRAVWHGGWKAVTRHGAGTQFDADQWALYRLDEDFSECKDLSQAHPDKLKELVDLWWAEAKALNALPLDDKWAARSNVNRGAPPRKSYTFYPQLDRIDRILAPDIYRRSYAIKADVEIPKAGARGVLLAFGTALAGYVLYVKDDRLVYEYVFSGVKRYVVTSAIPLTAGKHMLRYEFVSEGEGRGRGMLFIDEDRVASIEIEKTWPVRAVQGGLTCGRDIGLAISDAYQCPFNFTGIINSVVVELGDEDKAAAAASMAVWPPPLKR